MTTIRQRRIRWTASISPDVTGYTVYWSLDGTIDTTYPSYDVGNTTTVLVPVDIPGFPIVDMDILIGVAAHDSVGNESDMVTMSVPFDWTPPEAPSNIELIMHEFQVLEDATLTALSGLPAQGCKTLESYAGQLEASELDGITFRFPCIYVIAGPLKVMIRNRYDDKRASVILFVGDKNIRGSEAGTRGDTSSPGVYALLKMAREALHRVKVHADWTPFECIGEEVVAYSAKSKLCIYSATYETKSIAS